MSEENDTIDLISLKIIEKNSLNRSVREANERREDLARVLHRVENIYGEFERPLPFNREFSRLFIGNKKSDSGTNIEMVEDLPTLEQMLLSHQSREKYLQQVTVFIVGYSKVAQDRLRLMQEVNQFFLKSEDIFDSYIAREEKILNEETEDNIIDKENNETMGIEDDEPDYSASELSESMQQSLEACHSLTNRLGELNNEIIEYFVKSTQNKAGNKGKKKLEKALENAVNETNRLNEKLGQTSKIISEKDARIDNLLKQCEAKSKEVQKYKAAAESIKKAALEADSLRDQLKTRDLRIMKLESELIQTQIKIEEVKTMDAAQRANTEEMAKEYQEKSMYLEKSLENQKIEFEESKREMTRQHSAKLKQIEAEFEERIKQNKSTHEEEIKQLRSSEFDENAVALQWSEPDNDIDKPLTKSLSSISKNDKEVVLESKSPRSKGSSRIGSGLNKESRQQTAMSSGKDIWVFDDAPDLDLEEFWANIPRNHLLGRFSQYRQMSRAARSGLQDEMDLVSHSTARQIHSLKSQHQAHKFRWDEEREMLIEALRKVEEERKEVQKYADTALEEMEKFLSFMKSDNESKIQSVEPNTNHLNMLEIAEYVREYLIQQNLMNEPISSMITVLVDKCQLFQERTRISLPRFSTMIELHDNNNSKYEMIEINSQRDNAGKIDEKCEQLNENNDILFEKEIEDITGKRDVAVSASPSLLRIAFRDFVNPSDYGTNISSEGVTAKDLEVPSNFIDIQDMTGLGLIQHPIVVDYLHSYDHVLTFKEHFILIIENIENADLSDIIALRDQKPVSITSQHRIQPQIEEIGKSIEKILYLSEGLIEKILLTRKKKEPRSTNKKTNILQQSSVTKGKQIVNTKIKPSSMSYLNYISGECNDMKLQIRTMKHSFVLKFNVINKAFMRLRELMAALLKTSLKENNVEEEDSKLYQEVNAVNKVAPNYYSLSILFTRKDSESNIRRMQQAILQNKINDVIYEEAVEKMADYMEIPAKRLLVLVKKYMQRSSMQKIAEYVRRHNEFDSETFQILDKMEISNERKLRRYENIQEYFRNERIIRAEAMMQTFDKMQNSSSIFLIKPVLSLSSRKKLHQIISSTDIIHETQCLKNAYLLNTHSTRRISSEPKVTNLSIEETLFNDGKMWMPDYAINENEYNPNALIESKLFEIDTNRMLLPINNVCTPYNSMDKLDGQQVLPPNIAVRSYVAVAHPTLVDINTNSQIISTPNRKCSAPDSASKSRLSKDLSKHAPLPPITPSQKDSEILTLNDYQSEYVNNFI